MTVTNVSKMDEGQRMPIREQTNGHIAAVKETVERLNEIWDRIQMDEVERENRVHNAFANFDNLLRETVIAEEEMAIGLERDIAARRHMVQEMRALFNLPSFDESHYPSGSIALLKALDHDLATLTDQKEKAMRVQSQLHRRIESLIARLDLEMPKFDDVDEKVYDSKRLDKMRALIPELCTILKRRINRVLELQDESRKIYEALVPNASITNEELALLQTDYTEPEAVISIDSVHQSESLNQKLKDEYDAWLEKVSARYDELIAKMDELVLKCNVPAAMKQRANFDRAGVKNERELQRLEEEYERLQEKYNRAGPVFDKLNQWMALWKEKLDAEKRVCRVSFYKNRGGSVNNAVRRQKQVELQLPKTHIELKTMVDDYVQAFGDEDILVEGVRPDEYVARVTSAYQEEKEVQRVQKRFGRHPKYNPSVASPSRAPTPLRTPMVRLQTPGGGAGGFQTPRAGRLMTPGAGVLGKRVNLHDNISGISDLSEIHPVRGPIDGPRTSSPKPTPVQTPAPVEMPLSRSKPMSTTKRVPNPQCDASAGRTPKKTRWA